MDRKLKREHRIRSVCKSGGEKEKFLLREAELSDDYGKSLSAALKDSFVYSMSEARLINEGAARNVIKHPSEGFDQYKVRVARAAEWHSLSGSKKGLLKFLEYFGYNDAEVFPLRILDTARWNECELRIKDITNRSSLEESYLSYIAETMSPSYVRINIFRIGQGELKTQRTFDSGAFVSCSFVFHKRGSWDQDDVEKTDRHQI